MNDRQTKVSAFEINEFILKYEKNQLKNISIFSDTQYPFYY